jgi:hypothetical protein
MIRALARFSRSKPSFQPESWVEGSVVTRPETSWTNANNLPIRPYREIKRTPHRGLRPG